LGDSSIPSGKRENRDALEVEKEKTPIPRHNRAARLKRGGTRHDQGKTAGKEKELASRGPGGNGVLTLKKKKKIAYGKSGGLYDIPY